MVQNEKTKKPKQTQKTIIDEEENDIFNINTKYCGCYFSKQSSCIYSFVPDYTTSTQINLQAKKKNETTE